MNLHEKLKTLYGKLPARYRWSPPVEMLRFVYSWCKLKKQPESYGYALLPWGYAFYPKSIGIEVTRRCNLGCRMCYQRHTVREHFAGEMRLEEIKHVVDQFKGIVTCLGITGGEPFVRQDILSIIEYVTSSGFDLDIGTNATLIDKNIAEWIVELGVWGIGISIDGTEATHDRIRGMNGAFHRTISAIRYIQEFKRRYGRKKPRIRINCVIQLDNVDDIVDLVDIASELEVELQFQHLVWASEDVAMAHREAMRDLFSLDDPGLESLVTELKEFDIQALVDNLDRVKKRAAEMDVPLFIQQFDDATTIRRWYTTTDPIRPSFCFYPYRGIVRANGDLTACRFIYYSYGNLKSQGFRHIWNGDRARHFREVFLRTAHAFPGCVRCCKA